MATHVSSLLTYKLELNICLVEFFALKPLKGKPVWILNFVAVLMHTGKTLVSYALTV